LENAGDDKIFLCHNVVFILYENFRVHVEEFIEITSHHSQANIIFSQALRGFDFGTLKNLFGLLRE
jgi:hypothetical protein